MAVQRDKVIANAEKLVAKGKIEAAIKEYERLLDDNPNDVNTLNRIGDLWVRINRNDEACKVFGRIADHYSKDGFFLKAIAIYKKINKLDPSKLDVYGKLADLYAKQGLAMEAKSQYQVLADYYLKHGDPSNALSTYRKIAELDPNSINVHVKLADLYSQNNQTAEALKEYDRVGKMLLKRGMFDEATQVFKKALKIDSGNVDLAESLVNTLLENRDFDSATQIIETSLESNRENPRLIALMAKTHMAKGDLNAARSVLDRGLAANPNAGAIREMLADLYLKQGAPTQALNALNPMIDAAASRSERSAVEMIQKVLRVDSSHIPSLEKLVNVYVRLNEETNILAGMNSLAEAHISRSSFDAAAKTLQDLIKREPENLQHKNKLAFVQQQLSGGAPSAPPPPTIEPAQEYKPAEELGVGTSDFGGGAEIGFDLDASEPLDFGAGFSPEPEPMAPPPMFEPEPEEIPVATEEPGGEDIDFITEHLTEAEVFAKYGLADKAIEHLRAILDRAPKHVTAYDKLFHIYMDEGDNAQVLEIGKQYVELLNEIGEDEMATAAEEEMATRGFTKVKATPPPPPPPPPRPPAATPKVQTPKASAALDELAKMVKSKPKPAPPPPKPVVPEPEEEITLDLDSEPEFEFDVEASTAAEEVSVTIPEDEPLPEETLAPAAEADEPFFGIEGDSTAPDAGPSFATSPAVEELGEIDFYIEQELYDEAREKLDLLAARYPEDGEIMARYERLESAAVSPRPKDLSRDDIESELLSAIPTEEDEEPSAPPPPPPPPPPPAAKAPAPKAPAVDEGNLFADEDDFFDLASELEEELGEEIADEMVSLSEEEQSLEEIFREFKKGVEQQLDAEDYDTHYNLGIAYKEMGLVDEAIGEFQLASKDPKRTIECCSMLGLCFLEKGMPQLSIKWYKKGLEVVEITEDEHLGMLYDLGNAYLEVGDTGNAHKTFLEIYGVKSNYRDVTARIKQIQEGGGAASPG